MKRSRAVVFSSTLASSLALATPLAVAAHAQTEPRGTEALSVHVFATHSLFDAGDDRIGLSGLVGLGTG